MRWREILRFRHGLLVPMADHYENIPIQIYWKFHNQKTESFQIKILLDFQISAQNMDCGYSLELKT